MELLESFLGRNGYLPHGVCFTWSPTLLWTMVSADTAIALAYFSIPLAIVRFARRRADIAWRPVAWLFSAFIFACGLTHVMDVWTVWTPDYGLQALTKLFTAVASVLTAVTLWRLIPDALRIPSVQQLRAVIDTLEAEIGRRRGAEESLADTQQSLALTLDSIGAGFIATDREGRVVHINAAAEAVVGRPAAEASGQPLHAVFEIEDRPADQAARNPVDLLLERGITCDDLHQVVAVARDGRRTALELRAAITRSDDGTARGMVMVFRDTTALLRAQSEAQQLAGIVASSADAIISKSLDGRILSWNGAAQSMFGYSADEAVGRNVMMLIPPGRAAEEARILDTVMRGDDVPTFDTLRRAKDGRLIDVSVTVSPIRDGPGRVVAASTIARDVSQQRRAEAALRESEARLRFTVDAAQIGDWEIDLDTGLMHHSVRHDRCFGHDRFDGPWHFDTFVAHLHPDDRADAVAGFDAAVAAGRDWRHECRVLWPDTSVHWILMQGYLRLSDGSDGARMLGIVTDTTEQREAEAARLKTQQLEVENRQIQEASRLKSQFLANMSHELRTPLNAIIGFADLLHSGAVQPASPKHREYLGHIGASGRHLLQLINGVLDLAKVESGKFEFFPEPVQLPLLVKEVGDVLHTAMQRKGIALRLEIDDTLGTLQLDPARLKQVLYNYLSNAIKFTPDGGSITVRAGPEGPAHFRLEVEDTGIGIAAGDLDRLFIEFQQLDAGYSKQHPGTGLGLALTRRLVEAQGGSVGVRSTPGVGSVFHLVLARRHGSDAPAAAPAPAVERERWLLAIEGRLHDMGPLLQSLSSAGYQVDVALSGREALDHARSRSYDAITLDLLLPDQQGLEVLARIRTEGPNNDAPVLGMSLATDSGEAASFPIADVLGKPIRTDEVSTVLGRFSRGLPKPPTVMVIDDDPLALDMMSATLGAMGIECVCMRDGREALRQLDSERPDALVLDLMMPGFDGFEVLDALQRMPAWRTLPVFIWTSMLLSDDETASLARSARAILGKGGGSLPQMIDALRHARLPPRPASHEEA